MSDNKCVACGQWAGKGHKCPTVSGEVRPSAVGLAERDTTDSEEITDRVLRASAVIAEREKEPSAEDRERVERALGRKTAAARSKAANDPAVTPVDLTELSHDGSALVRSVAGANSDLPDEDRARLLQSQSVEVLAGVAKNTRNTREQFDALAAKGNPEINKSLLWNEACPRDIKNDILRDDPTEAVVREPYGVVRFPNDRETLETLSRGRAAILLARSEDCPPDIHARLSNPDTESDPTVRAAAVDSPHSTPDSLDRQGNDPDPAVRQKVIQHRFVRADTVQRVVASGSRETAGWALVHPVTNADTIRDIDARYGTSESHPAEQYSMNRSLIKHPNTPADVRKAAERRVRADNRANPYRRGWRGLLQRVTGRD